MSPPDEIRISALRLTTHIGVPDEERATSQVLEADGRNALLLPVAQVDSRR